MRPHRLRRGNKFYGITLKRPKRRTPTLRGLTEVTERFFAQTVVDWVFASNVLMKKLWDERR